MARGGARTGAGRPKGEETKVMRIPVGKVKDVMAVIDSPSYEIPLYSCKIQAGIPSPADDYVEGIVNLNSLLVPRPGDTFLVRATGDSMIDVGIYNDDMLIVDRSLPAKDGKIVIAALNGELTVKRLSIAPDGAIQLLPENTQFSPIVVTPECDLHIWGVVINCIRKLS